MHSNSLTTPLLGQTQQPLAAKAIDPAQLSQDIWAHTFTFMTPTEVTKTLNTCTGMKEPHNHFLLCWLNQQSEEIKEAIKSIPDVHKIQFATCLYQNKYYLVNIPQQENALQRARERKDNLEEVADNAEGDEACGFFLFLFLLIDILLYIDASKTIGNKHYLGGSLLLVASLVLSLLLLIACCPPTPGVAKAIENIFKSQDTLIRYQRQQDECTQKITTILETTPHLLDIPEEKESRVASLLRALYPEQSEENEENPAGLNIV